jgi:hypothetical protein
MCFSTLLQHLFYDEHFRWRVWSGQPMLTQIKLNHSCLLIFFFRTWYLLIHFYAANSNTFAASHITTLNFHESLRTICSLQIIPDPNPLGENRFSSYSQSRSIMMTSTDKWQAYVQASRHWRDCLNWKCFDSTILCPYFTELLLTASDSSIPQVENCRPYSD